MIYKQMIMHVYIFKNGMVAVFDQNDKQMPKFQGRRSFKLMNKIKNRIVRQKTKVFWY